MRVKRAGAEGDDALMRRFAEGDAAAFETLYRRYEAPVYGFCLRYLGDADRAADAFQEAFIRVVDAREAYEPRRRFRSWLFTIVRRVCADQARDAARFDAVRSPDPGSGDVALAPAAPRFERRVAARDELERLLAVLSPSEREVLLLSRYHGFSYAEIAELAGSTEAAVKQKAYRALKALRRVNR